MQMGMNCSFYFIERGDTCSMTLTCCLGETRSQIKAVAETDAQMIQIPISKMKDWMKKYDGWMEFVFNSYHTRTNEMLEAVDTLAFMGYAQSAF
jgi:CRP/FNR family transcriptional regulator